MYILYTAPHIEIIKPLLPKDSEGLICREEDVLLVIFLIFHNLAHTGIIIGLLSPSLNVYLEFYLQNTPSKYF